MFYVFTEFTDLNTGAVLAEKQDHLLIQRIQKVISQFINPARKCKSDTFPDKPQCKVHWTSSK